MKRLYLSFFLLSFAYMCRAQDTFQKLVFTEFPTFRFTKVFPTDSVYYMAATFTDTISPLRTGIMFTRFDSSFEMEILNTTKHPDKLFFDDHGDILATKDGNFLTVAAVSSDTPLKALLIKYSPAGDTLLTREYHSIVYPEWDYTVPNQIVERPDGGYGIFIGHREGDNVFFDLSLLTLDSAFNLQSYTAHGLPHVQETALSMLLDDDGGYLLGADRTNSGQIDFDFVSRTWIIKTDSVGNVLWEYLSPSGKLRAEAKAMVKASDGGLIVATGIGTEAPSNPFFHQLEWDPMIFKLDADRNLLWETPFRGARTWTQTRLVEMVEATDGSGYVALGKIAVPISDADPLPGSCLIKVSPEGDSLWARYFTYLDGTYIDPRPYDLKATPDGGYVAVGISLKVGQPAPGWILKVDGHGCLIPGCQLSDDTTSVSGGLPVPTLELAVYPNPVSDLLNFELRNGRALQQADFRIVDVTGRAIRTFQSDRLGSTFVLDVSGWAEGVYFLQFVEGERVLLSEKFIVSH